MGGEDFHRLDAYEDYPELYLRKLLPLLPVESMQKRGNGETLRQAQDRAGKRGETVECLVYVMKKPFVIPFSQPDPGYLEMAREGYKEWEISSEQLDRALNINV